jgi:hypothetical protein
MTAENHSQGGGEAGRKKLIFPLILLKKYFLASPSPRLPVKFFFLSFFLLASNAFAQDRPREDDMFGGAPPPSAVQSATQPASQPAMTDEEARRLGAPPATDAFANGRAIDDPLRIGGSFYIRAYGSVAENTPFGENKLDVPMLVEVYADARPTDRLRAMVLARMQYDPFLSTSFAGIQLPATSVPANPSVSLDQAWLSFDIAHTVFITAGRQHVKWGTAHVFSPTDFLSSQFRDPLAPIDTRVGVTMVKASLPWEKRGWNFYAVALFEPTQQPATGLGSAGSSGSTPLTGIQTTTSPNGTTFGDVGAAARAEATFGNTQIGADGLVQRGRHGRAGLDLTSTVGPIDFYAEAAIKNGSDIQLWKPAANPIAVLGILGAYQKDYQNVVVGAAGGMGTDIALPGNQNINITGEYFFNSAGYSDYHIYPWLLFNGGFQPFYNGKHYGALIGTLTDNAAHTTYTLSNIANFSDLSAVTRFDFSIKVISFLTLEAYADVHYGTRGGEFRLAINIDPINLGTVQVPEINVQPTIVDVGVGARLSL